MPPSSAKLEASAARKALVEAFLDTLTVGAGLKLTIISSLAHNPICLITGLSIRMRLLEVAVFLNGQELSTKFNDVDNIKDFWVHEPLGNIADPQVAKLLRERLNEYGFREDGTDQCIDQPH